MKFKSSTERSMALAAAQDLVASAIKTGRKLTDDENAEVDATIKAAEDFNRGTKGRALLDAIGQSARR